MWNSQLYRYPNGQLPAYEWNFEDVNPPVHAWACWQVCCIDGSHDAFLLRTVGHPRLISTGGLVGRAMPGRPT
ncbi:hypothetical protein [Calidifontibacter indicus]|uniref:hypothetical protein n=1 Tax=Calidifontibacter indicus TaxID=419650 RepID=UPI003D71252E